MECPLTQKEVSKCTKSCKYWSCVSPNCIIYLRDDASNGKFSDQEIAYLKGISVNNIVVLRQKAEEKIKRLLILEQYINSIECNTVDMPLELEIFIDLWMKRWPMSTGLWPMTGKLFCNLVDVDRFRSFCNKYKIQYTLQQILNVTTEELEMCKGSK